MKQFEFKLKDKTTKVMEFDELVRWACLIEGMEHISRACEEKKISVDSDEWVKPLAIQKYIDERFHSMRHDLSIEAALGNI